MKHNPPSLNVKDESISDKCGWQIESGTIISPLFCGNPRAENSPWCAEHMQDAADNYSGIAIPLFSTQKSIDR